MTLKLFQCCSTHVQQVSVDCKKERGGACGREVRSCQGFLENEVLKIDKLRFGLDYNISKDLLNSPLNFRDREA
ncbi:hypothetical protein AV530_017711 [Patagioenas fasciata monilis]|uniref:Uncharacterized protein n=1 Tax=Patagioenas fasciata monilis TaxID=372326 RepID=A0A1V4KVC5_PATFA|nr:hypothetical protein AV530_017711 [Patagioenas fasciata monilis]